jgi:hypothetical protein
MTEGQFTIDGIVARRDGLPYLRFFGPDGKQVAQVSVAAARKIAADIVQMAARTEADAIIHRFFSQSKVAADTGAKIMVKFREFRLALDREPVTGTETDPDTGDLDVE